MDIAIATASKRQAATPMAGYFTKPPGVIRNPGSITTLVREKQIWGEQRPAMPHLFIEQVSPQ
jgi:hypothetical protein